MKLKAPEPFKTVPNKPLTRPQDQRRNLLYREITRSGLTQAHVARLLNLKVPSTVSNWVNGERPIPYERVPQFCELFGTPQILWLEDDAPPKREETLKHIAADLGI